LEGLNSYRKCKHEEGMVELVHVPSDIVLTVLLDEEESLKEIKKYDWYYDQHKRIVSDSPNPWGIKKLYLLKLLLHLQNDFPMT
jgi:hypothetical protein